MPRSAKLGWTSRAVAVPLLLSLVLHGLLFVALWCWPTRTPSPLLRIESTRITLDTCVLDSPSSTLLPERELPADLLGSTMDAALAPQLSEPIPTQKRSVPLPDGKSEHGWGKTPTDGGDGVALFPLPATAASVVYVLDCSASMGGRKLEFARRKLIASLRRLPPATRFQVIDYNDSVETLDINGQRGLLPAEPTIINQAVSFLQTLAAAGASNHLRALCRGLDLRPDVLYFLTDGDDLKPEEVKILTRRNQRTALHTIELTHSRAPMAEGPLAHLAGENRGTCRRISPDD